jgi:hypothetical protein
MFLYCLFRCASNIYMPLKKAFPLTRVLILGQIHARIEDGQGRSASVQAGHASVVQWT